jgi:hypothetical protein
MELTKRQRYIARKQSEIFTFAYDDGYDPEIFAEYYMNSETAGLVNSEWNKMYGESAYCAYDYFLRELDDNQKSRLAQRSIEYDEEKISWIGYAYSIIHWTSGLETEDIYKICDFDQMYIWAADYFIPDLSNTDEQLVSARHEGAPDNLRTHKEERVASGKPDRQPNRWACLLSITVVVCMVIATICDVFLCIHFCKRSRNTQRIGTSSVLTASPAKNKFLRDIGDKYRYGKGTKQNYGTALGFYRKAANGGDTEAMVDIGTIYEDWSGPFHDKSSALSWFRKAADRGNTDALWHIGYLYYMNGDNPGCIAQAIEWFKKAADKGSTDAMCNIGYIYRTEPSVLNIRKALVWYKKAAAKGNSIAMGIVGDIYTTESSVKNTQTAVKWLNMAAEQDRYNKN